MISDEELKEKLLDSWNSFGIHYIEEESVKNVVKKWLDEYSFYLWVTNTKIYYIPNFYSDSNWWDEYAKMKLLFYNEMPKCAVMVCQDEEIKDTFAEMELGEHQWIEQHPGDIRCYRSYTSKGEGYDTSNILQFIWKKDIGLLGMRYAAHPGEGFSGYFWRDFYLEIDDMMFSIDAEHQNQ